MLKNESQTAVKIGNHGKLKAFSQLLEDIKNFRVKLPDTCFGEMFVSDFEKIIPIKFAQ